MVREVHVRLINPEADNIYSVQDALENEIVCNHGTEAVFRNPGHEVIGAFTPATGLDGPEGYETACELAENFVILRIEPGTANAYIGKDQLMAGQTFPVRGLLFELTETGV